MEGAHQQPGYLLAHSPEELWVLKQRLRINTVCETATLPR